MNLYSDKIEIKALSKIAIRMHQGINTVTEKIQYQEGGFPIIQSKHITQGRLDLSDARFVGALDFQKYKDKYNPQINDILICNIGTIGKSILIVEKVDFLIAWNLFLISLDDSQILSTYLKQYLDYLSNKNYFNQFLTGGTVKFINKSNIGGIKIPIPPIAEQKRIAEILDRTQSLISKRKEVIAKLDTLTQSIFIEMFGDPKTNPKNWAIKPMSSLFATSPIFGTMIPPVIEKLGWLSLRVSNIQDWSLDLSDRKYVDLPKESIERHSVKDGDLLLARAIASQNHLGKCVVAHPCGENWAFDSHLMRLRFDLDLADSDFIRHLFMTKGGRSLFLSASRKSTVQFNINTKEISSLKLPIPPISLQKEFAQRVEAVEKLKATHRASLSQLEALFASLQHRAFRGEL